MKLQDTQHRIASAGWVSLLPAADATRVATPTRPAHDSRRFDLIRPLRSTIDRIQVQNPNLAHRLCELIPSQCPFERDVKAFGKVLFHIPPLCKLNPVYDEIVALRFRALCYLADECGEDIGRYC